MNPKYKDRTIPAKNSLLYDYKERAKTKNLEFSLSFDDFIRITSSNCFYCGNPPSNLTKLNSKRNPSIYVYNGIDRKNNSIGYTLNNSLSCCSFCNSSKSNYSYDDFIAWVFRISENIEKIKNKLNL